ncbi:MAG: hypothetical protein GX295_07090 [Syntrophomonadaceae bacterium]|nr:hypothetical protein [Syntrophomonadaceae bacterium]
MRKKRFRNKKLVLVLSLLILTSFLLTGCGSKSTPAPEPSTPATQSETPATSKTESIVDLLTKGEKTEGIYYDFTVSENTETLQGKMWIQGTKAKTEMVVEGETMISLIDGNTFYTYLPAEKTALKFTVDQQTAQQAKNQNPYLVFSELKDTVENKPDIYKELDSVVFDGVKCRVLEYTDPQTKERAKVWVREDYGIVSRVEAINNDGSTWVMEVKNIKVGSQPVEVFTLPADVPITDMDEMMKQLGQNN